MGDSSGAFSVSSPASAGLILPDETLPVLSRTDARVGLFGGTFDPVHLGHLAVARAALSQLSLDYLFFVPAAQAPLRGAAPVASIADRLDLLRHALAEEKDPRLGVLEIEARAGGVQYTVDTLRRLHAAWPQAHFFWLLGADQFAQLDRWREPEQLARLAEFAVLDRPGFAPAAPPAALVPVLRWRRLTGAEHPASAAEIRRRLRLGEHSDLGLPRAVAAAIEERKLYR
jgi:nicotinate-nucleotide adenylyltransferase